MINYYQDLFCCTVNKYYNALKSSRFAGCTQKLQVPEAADLYNMTC